MTDVPSLYSHRADDTDAHKIARLKAQIVVLQDANESLTVQLAEQSEQIKRLEANHDVLRRFALELMAGSLRAEGENNQ